MASLKDIEKEIFQLPPHELAILTRNLIRSLEKDGADVDSLESWIAEADRRYQELKEGKVKGIPADQVFDEVQLRDHLTKTLYNLNNEIEKSKDYILRLEDNWDDEGSKKYLLTTYNKAIDILRSLIIDGSQIYKKSISIPRILPGPNGSIDLHWQTEEYDLLMNIPENPIDPVSFAGDDSGKNCINGTFDNPKMYQVLLAWLK
jgi:putative addiction module component (TIGR02574 family)